LSFCDPYLLEAAWMTKTKTSGNSNAPGRAESETDRTLQWATAAINQGRGEDAERLAREVLGRIPQHPAALHLLGCALLLQGRPGQAVVPLEKAVRALQDPAIETRLAVALRLIGRTEDALARATRATRRRPANADAFHELGLLLFSLRRSDEAVAAIEHGLELVPGAPELWIQLGGILHIRGDRTGAKAAFARALAIRPDNAGAHYGMGAVLVDEGEFAPAAEHLQRSLAGNPGDVQSRMKLGVCLLELGRADEALGYLRTAIRSDPKLYPSALQLVSSAGSGCFWLRPSTAKKMLS
jgi:Flp pilus assembly protein TadD